MVAARPDNAVAHGGDACSTSTSIDAYWTPESTLGASPAAGRLSGPTRRARTGRPRAAFGRSRIAHNRTKSPGSRVFFFDANNERNQEHAGTQARDQRR